MEEAEDIDAEQNALEYGEEDTPTEEQEAEALAQNKAAFKELTGEEWSEEGEESTPEESGEVDHEHEGEEVIPVSQLGQKASLDEQGYKAVAALKNNAQMDKFIRRAAQNLNLEIKNQGSLAGIVPYYSGVNAEQSYEKLLLELERGAHAGEKKQWIRVTGEEVPEGEEQ
mmetsp:Transcript_153849/g.268118  ORF Transcript_153849/g.268118 Transcript_153849/m.268118 type:complete len:170 (+) Transcript_153849:1-510(+)